ncbi:phasin family protein [Sphingomicrobium sediminis]|uniref:Phasin family protein n=1 Tax=Sphingomicrobium sediminis TaxID=2950949 RepID=A0A9X2EJ63_9SPHN|nr:phasin family protein [Sphingomicrobium sediminis]MCM8558472.1 phasin family protein [Sphingomicrobium sediminis]
MADKAKSEKAKKAPVKKADAPAEKPVVAAAAKVEAKAVEVKAAPEKVEVKSEKAAPAKKPAPKAKKVKKVAAKKAAPVKKKLKAPVQAKKAAPKPAKEGMFNMTNEWNKWFAGFEMPQADKVEEMIAAAGKQGEEFIAKGKHAGEELAEMTKANIEAMIEAGRIYAGGAKDLGTELIEDGRNQFDAASDNLRKFAEAKNPQEFVALQSELAKAQFDQFVAEGSKLTEKMVKLAGDVMQPVQNRASVNAEKVKELMA